MSPRRKKVPDPTAPSTDIKFGDLPSTRGRYDWTTIAAKAKANPMQWGEVFAGDMVSIRNAIAQGNVLAVHPALGFQVRTVNNTRGQPRLCDLWLRYNPELRDDTIATIIEQRLE